MSDVNNDIYINQKLKHFEAALGTVNSKKKSYLEWAVQKLGRLNNQIAATSYLKLYRPECIGSTELHVAYYKRDLEAFCILISHGADYTLKNQNGLTVLHSIMESKIEMESTLKCYPDPDSCKVENPYITAILSAHLQYKQSANPCDPNGLSHFHAACMTNNVEAVEFFLENGVSIDRQVNANSSYFAGYTALHFAVRYFSFQVVEILLRHGADINLKNAERMTPISALLKRNFELLAMNNDLQKSLEQERDSSEKISRLLLNNTDSKNATIIDESGLSSLHVASALMDLMAVEELLKKVTDINHCVNVESPQWAGYTALHFAAIFNIKIVKFLVKRGADLQAKDAKGVTPLDLCLERYKVEDIHSILSQKEEWKKVTFSDGKTKLLDFIAAMISYEHFEKLLRRVTENKVITLPDNSPLWPGSTLMHLVVLFAKDIEKKICPKYLGVVFTKKTNNGNDNDNKKVRYKQRKVVDKMYLDMLSALFEKNEKIVETQDIYGRTPLHLCFYLDMAENMTDTLMTTYQKLAYPPDLIDEDNLSILHIACAKGNENLIKTLLEHSNNCNLAYTGKPIKGLIIPGWTSLHIAVIQKQYNKWSYGDTRVKSIMRMLLKNDANINAKDSYELTPIHLLVVPNHYDSFNLFNSIDDILLSSPHVKVNVAGDTGLSYLHVACFGGKEDIVKKLIDAGAQVNGSIKFIPDVYDDFQPSYPHTNRIIESANYKTALHIACMNSRESKQFGFLINQTCESKLIMFLIDRGADIFAENSKGLPLLYQVLEDQASKVDKLKTFARTLEENEHLKIKVEKDIGLTMLHIACRMKDRSLVKNLLENGDNVNAQIRLDSPIWPGCTPLHTLMGYVDNCYVDDDDCDADRALKLLLAGGADVTVQDKNGQTPLHMAYDNYVEHLDDSDIKEKIFKRLVTMIATLKDFSMNPRSVDGTTHFHIACALADVFSVEKFLNSGHVDVDQPIDFFVKSPISGCSRVAGCAPLHLAVTSTNRAKGFVDSTLSLEIVNLLLEHGANVDAENSLGETPFYMADHLDILERLARGGANVKARNAIRQTPLEYWLSKGSTSSCKIKMLLRYGFRYNAFNITTEVGYIGLTTRSLSMKEMRDLLSVAIFNFPELLVDEMGRTVIHNLVSIDQKEVPIGPCYISLSLSESSMLTVAYASVIQHLAKMRCDVDAQDKLGRTALHLAAKFKHLDAISGLLLAGADINITDVNGQTPLAHQTETCSRCDKPADYDYKQCAHYKVFNLFALHVKKLQYCGLDVPRSNEEIVATAYPNFTKAIVYQKFIDEFNSLKNVKIGSGPLTLHNFMSELDVVVDYSIMSKVEANTIDRFFLTKRQFGQNFGEVGGLLKLQYRKAIKRTELLQEAKMSLNFLTGFQVPELCARIIFRFLKNSELESLITASENAKNNMDG